MSIASKAMRPMRIVALPLLRANVLSKKSSTTDKNGASDPTLTYYHFQLKAPRSMTEAGDESEQQGRLKTWVSWASTKAADTWAGFGKAPEGNWKLRIYQYGERIVDRMDFEELALKGIDPSLGPSLTHPDFRGRDGDKMSEEKDGKKQIIIPLVYPPFIHPQATISTTPHPSLIQLKALLANRKPRHRKGFYTWMIIAPFTAPFMIVPIIPNLPFFFCVWRSWSHYRAYRATDYLEKLIDHGAIVPEASEELDKLYAEYDPSKTSPPTPSSTSDGKLDTTDSTTKSEPAPNNNLLTRAAVPAIQSTFNLTGTAVADVYRALEQARLRSTGEDAAK